jgi:hypothetical protein
MSTHAAQVEAIHRRSENRRRSPAQVTALADCPFRSGSTLQKRNLLSRTRRRGR